MAPALSTVVQQSIDLLQAVYKPDDMTLKALHPEFVRDCKGLLFNHLTKTGAVIAYETSHAYLIMHLSDGTWSAPMFMSGKNITLGLTAGYSSADTVLVLQSDKAIRHAQSSFKLGVDFNVKMAKGKSGAHLELTAMDADSFAWGIGKGVMLDLSVSGGNMHPDDALNESVYGGSVTTDDILSGKVKAPAEFDVLYRTINAIAVKAPIHSGLLPELGAPRRSSMDGRRSMDAGDHGVLRASGF